MFFNSSRKWVLGLGLGAAVMGLASLSVAGMKWSYPLTVTPSTGWVEGSLGTVRNAGDVSKYIGCWISSGSGGIVHCYGYDGTNYLYCYHPKSKPNFTPQVLAAQSLNGDSLLQFKVATDGTCEQITVTNASYWEPKAP